MAAGMLCACGSQSMVGADGDPYEAQDPFRPFNETVFKFNLRADRNVIYPLAKGYHMLPAWMRYGTSNFFSNLKEPVNGLNSLAQGNFRAFGTTLFRFLLNSTFGFAGLRDFAGENGLDADNQTFDRTLRAYGVDTGPYLVLPFFGPSSVRGVGGKVGDYFSDPFSYYLTTAESVGRGVAVGVITRDENEDIVNQLYYQSLDPYVASRAAYLQHGALVSDTVSPIAKD